MKENVPGSRRVPSWVRYPWYYLFYVNALGGAFALAWWFDWIDPSGGTEWAFGVIIASVALSVILLLVAGIVTLVWFTKRSESSDKPKS